MPLAEMSGAIIRIGLLEHFRNGEPVRRLLDPLEILSVNVTGGVLAEEDGMSRRRTLRGGSVGIRESHALARGPRQSRRLDIIACRFG